MSLRMLVVAMGKRTHKCPFVRNLGQFGQMFTDLNTRGFSGIGLNSPRFSTGASGFMSKLSCWANPGEKGVNHGLYPPERSRVAKFRLGLQAGKLVIPKPPINPRAPARMTDRRETLGEGLDWFISMDSSYSLNPPRVKVACPERAGASKCKGGPCRPLCPISRISIVTGGRVSPVDLQQPKFSSK